MATRKIAVHKPKEGQPPTETLVLQWLLEPETVNVSTTTPSSTAVEGSTLQIDDEYMYVTDASAPDRLVVKRGAFETEVVEHAEGVQVLVWGEPTDGSHPGKHPIARSELAGVGATIQRQQPQEGSQAMTDNAQQLNNKSASAQGAPPPYGNKEPKDSLREKAQPGRFEADTRRSADGRELDINLVNQHPQRITKPEPRGAGSGEEANATRGRVLDCPGPTISHQEHVDELLTIAQLNEDFNNEMNGRVYERSQRTAELITNPPNPADGEEQSTPDAYEAARLSYEASDPFKRAETIQGEMDARAARDRKQEEELYGDQLESKDEPDERSGERATLARTAGATRSTLNKDAQSRRTNESQGT